MNISLEEIEKDYQRVKQEFCNKDILMEADAIAEDMKNHKEILKQIFRFLVSSFEGKLRNDKKTPLVFHSIYLTKLIYLCGERNLNSLIIPALHDVLEDTDISEEGLLKKNFMNGRGYLINYLKILKENKDLSREPNGISLPPRYIEHIKRIIGSPREVINTEVIDRFSDLMDLEYILNLPKNKRRLRLISKLIKVKSFVHNITKNRDDLKNFFENIYNKYKNEHTLKLNILAKIDLRDCFWKNYLPYKQTHPRYKTVGEALDITDIFSERELKKAFNDANISIAEPILSGDIAFFASKILSDKELRIIHENQIEIEKKLGNPSLRELSRRKMVLSIERVLAQYGIKNSKEVANEIVGEAKFWYNELCKKA